MAPHAEETTTSTDNIVPIPVNPAKLAASLGEETTTRQSLFPLQVDKEAELEGKNGQAPAKVCAVIQLHPVISIPL